MMRLLLFLGLFIGLSWFANANIKLPQLFSDGMVLQRNKPINVWGSAEASEKVKVQFNSQIIETVADDLGQWKVVLNPEKAGGPFKMIIKGNNTIVINNILVGEVWVCSGQSNMEFEVKHAFNAKQEIQEAHYPLIRQFKVEKEMSSVPKQELNPTQWEVCSSETVGGFTAVGYYFAKKIYSELNIPVGIINTTWGGTCIETWTSREAFQSSDEFKKMMVNVPNVDIESLQKEQEELISSKIKKLQGAPINSLNESGFKELDFNDANWPEMYVPQLWENQGLENVDGTVWFRKSVQISKGNAGKSALLKLAKIDDQDTTYINGIQVGTTKRYDENREYKIKPYILKEGLNTIAIKVFDYAGGGGIWGDKAELKLIVDNRTIDLSGSWKYQVTDVKSSVSPNSYPSLLFNAMVNPLIPYSIQGVLWYQGEANVNRAVQYKKAFPLMINDWRNQWGQGGFPFYFVQLSTYDEFGGNSNKGSKWAELREAQDFTLNTVKNTGMAVTIDIGNPKDIHPLNKQDVGKRLALIALDNVYGKDVICSGPTYKAMEIKGNKVILILDHLGSGLIAANKYGYIKGFEVAGTDKVFHYAKAYIEGNKVIVSCSDVKIPRAVRYGWADDAGDCNLYNKEGLPAAPFRTDNWDNITKDQKYRLEN